MTETTTASGTVQAKIDEMVRRIVSAFQPERIILFGSRARGGTDPASDVDLLVVMRYRGPRIRKMQEIHRALADVGVSKDVLVVSPEYFETYRDVVGTIAYPAAQEGKILYERPA